jgi:crotonobetainyl-CoA:carnitine CoA-transferase CaiB-like acyl-CoA transferase
MLALTARERTGRGEVVDLAIIEPIMAMRLVRSGMRVCRTRTPPSPQASRATTAILNRP